MSVVSNNPGNIRHIAGQDWLGSSGVDPRGFVIFDTMAHGVRALARVFLTYQDVHDLHTVLEWITRFAPPSENDTTAYIADVCQRCGWRDTEQVDLHVPSNMTALLNAVTHHETGEWLDSTVLASGVSSAFA